MSRKKQKRFIVMGRVTVDVDAEISANSLEEALERSKEMGVEDFVDILGEYNDGSRSVRGVFEVDQ